VVLKYYEYMMSLKQGSVSNSILHSRNMLSPKETKLFRNSAKRVAPRALDRIMHEAHDKVFACTDCLECANCCKTTGPLLTDKDTVRIAKHLRMSAADFESEYLRVDEDGDHVFQSLPCPFLAGDNYCMIYEDRPKACKEYPHTDRVKQFQLIDLTLKNEKICPAVEQILPDVLSQISNQSTT
jgi:Fe-S-cluster containining protein